MDECVLTIDKLVFGGKGLGLFNFKPVFVPFVLPGEKVRVQIEKRRSQYFEAKLLEILEASPDRVEPPCPYFKRCGGCQWQHLSYEKQLEWKQKILKETLRRTGHLENPNVLPCIPSPKIWGWRSRMTFHSNTKGELGFFEPNTHRVVDIEECLIAEEKVNEKLTVLRTKYQAPSTRDFELRSDEFQGFSQVNLLQNENLKRTLKEWVEKIPHETIVELFCGSGNLTEVLIPLAKEILAIDSEKQAIDHANSKLKHFNTQTLLHFQCTDALRFFAQHKPEKPLDLLVLDPPRDGAAGVVEGVLKNRPKNIIYISCNPATLARDLKFLKDFAGYHLIQSQPIDMFPMSYHIESINWISQPIS